MRCAKSKLYQIIDANLNRCSEGLRVIEEIGRFILSDTQLQRKTKRLRQQLSLFFIGKTSLPIDRIGLIGAGRDSESDVGRSYSTAKEMSRKSFESILRSNFSRAEESARALEEFSKVIDPKLGQKIKEFRFKLYTLEKGFVEKHLAVGKRELLQKIGIYPIIDREQIDGKNPISVARRIIEGGAGILQYRDKVSDDGAIYDICMVLTDLCRKKDVRFIVNDAVDIALAVDADGVHLGQTDMPAAEARAILGPDKIIGKSSHNTLEAGRAAKENIDYLAVGPMFPTTTKPGYRVAGLKLLRWAKANTSLPVVAIGGINLKNIDQVFDLEPDGVAVVSAILSAGDFRKQTARFARRCRTTARKNDCLMTANE